MAEKNENRQLHFEETAAKARGGMGVLVLNSILTAAAIAVFVLGIVVLERTMALGVVMLIVGALYGFVVGPLLYAGLKVIRPNEAMVLTLFGRYVGTLRGEGYYYVNPFCVGVAVSPPGSDATVAKAEADASTGKMQLSVPRSTRKISLKTMTLDNKKQKINDQLGNPIEIGVVVIWRVTNTVKAVFNVDNYFEYLSIQCDSALRNIVRLYPYDAKDEDGPCEKSLRGSSAEIAESLREELQAKVDIAGIEVLEARITHLAYAPEIAAAMLQRQQASAVVDARQLIVEGAVGMVEMALERMNERQVVQLDEERKAAMVSNLMVVLCGSKDAQPIVNSGSIY